MTYKSYVEFIQSHGQEAKMVDGKLMVLDQWTETKGPHEGMLQQKWRELEQDDESVRDWLGY